jgi:hypothetical protein
MAEAMSDRTDAQGHRHEPCRKAAAMSEGVDACWHRLAVLYIYGIMSRGRFCDGIEEFTSVMAESCADRCASA